VPLGVVLPRIAQYAPASSYASGDDAIALAESAGLHLDLWQQHVLRASLGERVDGNWAAFRVGLVLSRQNGKSALLAARELAGLFLFNETLILHSAHLFDTAQTAFNFTTQLILNTPSLRRKLKASRNNGIDISKGVEGITLASGQQLRFRSRSTRAGRGLAGDVVILDEAAYLQTGMMNALVSTMTTSPNPQLWYVSTAVDRLAQPDGLVLAKVRENAIGGASPDQTFLEWSVPTPPSGRPEDVDIHDESLWPLANPALGIRISLEYIRREIDTLGRRGFAVERLGVGDWPREEDAEHLVPPAKWAAGADPVVPVTDPVVFAAEVTPDRARASIVMASWTPDGRVVVEVVEDRDGTGWVVPRMLALVSRWDPAAVVVDRKSPTATVIQGMEAAGVEVTTTSTDELVQATGAWFDDVIEGRFVHRDDPILNDALAGATKRTLAGGWALDRRGSTYVSTLVAAVLARWGLLQRPISRVVPDPIPVSSGAVATKEIDFRTVMF